MLKRAADLAEAIYAVPTASHRGLEYSRYSHLNGNAAAAAVAASNGGHDTGHVYNEAVEEYNRAQHNSSSSPNRGYNEHHDATSPGPTVAPSTAVQAAASYSTAQHISNMMGGPGSPGLFQSSSSKLTLCRFSMSLICMCL